MVDDPDERDLRFLEEELYRHNVASTGIRDGRLLAIVLRDEKGIRAGLSGHTWGGVLEVGLLWVREDLRGQGYGTRLLAAAEEEAVRRGCVHVILDTHSFQAPDLYRRLGYEVYGVMPDYPQGHSKIFLKKRLGQGGGSTSAAPSLAGNVPGQPRGSSSTRSRTFSGDTIASVEVVEVACRYPRTIGRNAVLGSHGAGATAAAVILHLAGGATGWGLVCGKPGDPDGLIARRFDELFDPAIGVLDSLALWADVALHDLAGVLTGQPIYRMLGGRGEPNVAVYDASIYFDDLDPPANPRGVEAVLENVRDGWDQGYRAFKLKVGRGFTWMPEAEGLERDVQVTRAVRDAFPSARLLVDGNNGFTVEGALRYLDRARDAGLFWVEELFHEHDAGLRRLRAWLAENSPQALIADGEYRPVVDEVVRFAREGLIDVLLMDVTDYGLTAWRRLSASLEGSPIRSSPHAWGHPLKTLYAAQIAAGLPGIVCVEAVRGETIGVDTSGYTLVDGVLMVPDAPGFGIPAPGR